MKILIVDIECNSLNNPSKIWCVCLKDTLTGERYVYTDPMVSERQELLQVWKSADKIVGHNLLEYDYPNIVRLLGEDFILTDPTSVCLDTLILSRLIDYPRCSRWSDEKDPKPIRLVRDRAGKESIAVEQKALWGGQAGVLQRKHSIEAYGEQFGIPKGEYNDWTKLTPDMVEYCNRDVDICERIFYLYSPVVFDPEAYSSIELEQRFQFIVNDLHTNGFSFNNKRASELLDKVTQQLGELDHDINEAFPAKLKLVREVHPRRTKHGTFSRTDFRWLKGGDLSDYTGDDFCLCRWEEFNAGSHKQIIEVLSNAGWKPTDKTKTHAEAERTKKVVDNKDKLDYLSKYGWKINEQNLSTLPSSAPKPARLLAKRILLESRRRTLTEWLGLVQEDQRIHGRFYGIGAWTHRMAHQQPNTANIPNSHDINGQVKLLGKELRSLWQAPPGRLLVGVDAEGIQLRIFAHLINDQEFTDALVNGKKSDKTDPHSLNQKILGSVCKSRAAAKRFIYALLLGAGISKLAEILECPETECKKALDILMQRYAGWANLKNEVIPKDAKRGFFIGLDGRSITIPGDTVSERRHLVMSGYLQNGEAIIMKKATIKFYGDLKEFDTKLVNLVHDEWQAETPNKMRIALAVAKTMDEALQWAGEDLKLRCPMKGSYYNDDAGDYTVGRNWSVTH